MQFSRLIWHNRIIAVDRRELSSPAVLSRSQPRRDAIGCRARGLRLSRLAGADRVAGSAELASFFFAACSRERVDLARELDVDETCAPDHCLPSCTRQGTRNSARPEVDVLEGARRHGFFNANVGNRHASTRLEDSLDLPVDTELVGTEIDDAVRNHDIGPAGFDR